MQYGSVILNLFVTAGIDQFSGHLRRCEQVQVSNIVISTRLYRKAKTQGFDGNFGDRSCRGKRLFDGSCRDEDFAERIEAEREQRPSGRPCFLTNGAQTRHGDTGFDGERHGESHERARCTVCPVGQCVASSAKPLVQVAEHGFDRPPLTICGECDADFEDR